MISTPVRWLQKIGRSDATVVATVITFWAQAEPRAFLDGGEKSGARQHAAKLGAFLRHGFLQIDDHHDAGLDGRAEERNVADPDGHAEVEAERKMAGEGEPEKTVVARKAHDGC